MLADDGPIYRQELGDGLVLRTAAGGQDVERVVQFNGTIHGSDAAVLTRNLLLQHPDVWRRDLVFVEQEGSGGSPGRVVSSLCLIPWTWRYEGVQIPAGEMGIVGTLESHRQRGLIRAQVVYFERRLAERGCLLSHIQGIPYYYRQYGYEYALPLEGGLRLEFRDIPGEPDPRYTFRRAGVADIPILARLYDEAAEDLAICAVRDEATWRYLLTQPAGSATEAEWYLVEGPGGVVAGYWAVPERHFGQELVVSEVSRLSFDAAVAVLHHATALGRERGKPGIRLNLPPECTLMRVGRSLGGHDLGRYAWQIRLVDPAALLRTLAPVFSRRVAESPFAGLTGDFDLGLYRRTLRMRFRQGDLIAVEDVGFIGGGTVRLPPLQLVPLLLGYRTFEQLRQVYPDVGMAAGQQLLVDTLFPKLDSFIYTIY
jgi:hypothetical protein